MNDNEAGFAHSMGNVKCLFFCCFLLLAFVVIKSKVMCLEGRNSSDNLVNSTDFMAGPETTGNDAETVIADFMIDSGSRALMVNLSEMEKIARIYYPIILKASRKHNVDPHLIKAIIVAESGFNPRAVSRVGARGLMQLMPITAKAMGLKDAFNPEKNIEAGVRYFRKLLDKFNGNTKLALAAYNAGITKVKAHGGVPPIAQTTHFVRRVSKLQKAFKKSDTEQVVEAIEDQAS